MTVISPKVFGWGYNVEKLIENDERSVGLIYYPVKINLGQEYGEHARGSYNVVDKRIYGSSETI